MESTSSLSRSRANLRFDVLQGRAARNDEGTVRVVLDLVGALIVVFVRDFADDLLEHVLHGDHARGPAVFVLDHGHMQLFLLEVGQDLVQRLVLGHEEGGSQKFHNGPINLAVEQRLEQVLGVDQTEDVVLVVLVDGDAGVGALVDDELGHVLDGAGGVGADHVRARDHDLLDELLVQPEHVQKHGNLVALQLPVGAGFEDVLLYLMVVVTEYFLEYISKSTVGSFVQDLTP